MHYFFCVCVDAPKIKKHLSRFLRLTELIVFFFVHFYGDQNDTLVLISSSGNSMNMVRAAKKAKQLGINVITFTGFNNNNPLKKEGDLNFYVDSKAYNIIENTHQIWLLTACDLIIGKAEYSA